MTVLASLERNRAKLGLPPLTPKVLLPFNPHGEEAERLRLADPERYHREFSEYIRKIAAMPR